MKQNIEIKGRIARGILSLTLLGVAGTAYYFEWSIWIIGLFGISSAFVAFEAVKGWCVARACGIKTKF
jgi:hypothetical protein